MKKSLQNPSRMSKNRTFLMGYAILASIFFFHSAQAQWQFLGSAESCASIDFDSEGDTLLVLTTGGLYYSVDTSATWLSIPVHADANSLESIQIENGSLYLTAKRYVQNKILREVYRSDDWGIHWQLLTGQMDPSAGFIQVVVKADTFYFIDRTHIHISYNKGDQFSDMIPNTGFYSTYYIHHHILYSKVSQDMHTKLLRSRDDGHSWDTLVTTEPGQYISDINSIDGVLWKIEHHPQSQIGQVQKSFDDGDTWITTGYVEGPLHGFFDRQPEKIIGLSGQLYIIADRNSKWIYYSSNDGLSWNTMANVDERDVFFSGGQLFFTSLYGFYASTDHGVTLERKTAGIKAATVVNIASSGSSLWAKSQQKVYTLSGDNLQWDLVEGFRDVEATRNGQLLAHVNSEAQISLDHGENWIPVTNANLGQSFPYPVHYVMCAGDFMYISTSSYDLYYSSNSGNTWNKSNQSYGYLFNYNDKYLLQTGMDILVSNNGTQWSALPRPEHPDLHIFMDFLYWQDPYYFLGCTNLLMRLHKDDAVWEEIEEPSLDFPAAHRMSMISYGDILFLTVYGKGVFGSRDYGQTWYPVNEGLTNFKTITMTKDNDALYLGTDGGVWKRSLEELTVSVSDPFPVKTPPESCWITHDIVPVYAPDESTQDFEIKIFSADGKILYEKSIFGPSYHVQLGDHPPGLYYINIISSNTRVIKRVLKL